VRGRGVPGGGVPGGGVPGGARRIVVVGNGMAGFRFVQDLAGLAPGIDIVVVGEEPGGAYNRARLPLVLAGAAAADSIELADPAWYPARGARLLAGTAARIDRAGRVLALADGRMVPYDVLVLATGGASVLPPVSGLAGGGGPDPGAAGEPAGGGGADGGLAAGAGGRADDGGLPAGVVAFRTLADCRRIQALAGEARTAVVLGGGVLGLETARALAVRGLPVTLLQRGPRLMERQLDAPAGRVLARTARSLGVAVRAGVGVAAVATAGGRLTGVVLDDGTALGTDLLVLCCGTRPRTELARAAGLRVGTGVVVDDQLRSVTDPAVFAIGDCAEHRGRTHGLVAAAWAQAQTAARAVAGLDRADGGAAPEQADGGAGVDRADGGPGPGLAAPAVLRLKAAGIELAVLGAPHGGGGAEVVRFTDPARGVYQKLVVRDGRLAGAILLGDTRTVGTLTQLLDRGAALPADRASLLTGRTAAAPGADGSPVTLPGHATICQCNGVTKAAICAAWQDGARDTGQVSARTRAATGCGTCRDAVEGIVAWLAAAEPGLVPA
jgi:assimilatory nitrate reductase electron transfer subunit